MRKEIMKTLGKLTLIFLAVLFISCNADPKDASRVTPISQKDKETFQGTYEIQKAEISERGGSQIKADNFDVFLGYMAIDLENQRLIFDVLIVEGGAVALDLSEVRTGFFYDNLQAGFGGVTCDDIYITERISNAVFKDEIYQCNYQYKKMSDNIINKYFDILTERATGTSNAFNMSENIISKFLGCKIFYHVFRK